MKAPRTITIDVDTAGFQAQVERLEELAQRSEAALERLRVLVAPSEQDLARGS